VQLSRDRLDARTLVVGAPSEGPFVALVPPSADVPSRAHQTYSSPPHPSRADARRYRVLDAEGGKRPLDNSSLHPDCMPDGWPPAGLAMRSRSVPPGHQATPLSSLGRNASAR
jgi:hypothetical protein